jgi:hypothetical protein
MAILMAGAVLTSRVTPPATTSAAADPDVAGPVVAARGPATSDSSELGEDEEDTYDMVDLFGNQVTDAVAKYKFDPAGSLYEVHSPRTELPRLVPPKS